MRLKGNHLLLFCITASYGCHRHQGLGKWLTTQNMWRVSVFISFSQPYDRIRYPLLRHTKTNNVLCMYDCCCVSVGYFPVLQIAYRINVWSPSHNTKLCIIFGQLIWDIFACIFSWELPNWQLPWAAYPDNDLFSISLTFLGLPVS